MVEIGEDGGEPPQGEEDGQQRQKQLFDGTEGEPGQQEDDDQRGTQKPAELAPEVMREDGAQGLGRKVDRIEASRTC